MFDPSSPQEQAYRAEKKPTEKLDVGEFPFPYCGNVLEKLEQGVKGDGHQPPFGYNYALVNQMQLAVASTAGSMFGCDVCGLVFGSAGLLSHHKRIQHLSLYPCNVCPSTFNQEDHLKIHKESAHSTSVKKSSAVQTEDEEARRSGRRTPLDIKPKDLFRPKQDEGHVMYPKGFYPVKKKRAATIVKCHKCDGSGIVVVETAAPAQDKRFRCNICGSTFATYSSMWSHRRLHSGEKPYKCEVCGVAFARAAYLKNHSRVHTGERPFKCDVCGMQFSQSAHLKNHSRIHSGERPYECDVCRKTFARHSTLWNHRRIHTGEKPYECGICGSAFNQATHLRNHVKVHTGEKEVTCDVCGAGFTDRATLRRHHAIHDRTAPLPPPLPSFHHYHPPALPPDLPASSRPHPLQ